MPKPNQPVRNSDGKYVTPDNKVLTRVSSIYKRTCNYHLYQTSDGEYWLREDEHVDDDWDTVGVPTLPGDWITNAQDHWMFKEFSTTAPTPSPDGVLKSLIGIRFG